MPVRVLNIGSLNIDHVYRVDQIVRPGETIASARYTQCAGGKGFNQSIALARAGANVAHAGCIGPEGRWLKTLLARDGADVSRVLEVAEPTGHAIIQVAKDGENAIVLFPGANFAPAESTVRGWLDDFEAGDWLLCQNEMPFMGSLIQAAKKRGMTICFNPAPYTSAVSEYPIDSVDWLVVNEIEGAALANELEPEKSSFN